MNREPKNGGWSQPEPPRDQANMDDTSEGVSLGRSLRRSAESENELEFPTPKEMILDNESI
jgi:hypothetical protein